MNGKETQAGIEVDKNGRYQSDNDALNNWDTIRRLRIDTVTVWQMCFLRHIENHEDCSFLIMEYLQEYQCSAAQFRYCFSSCDPFGGTNNNKRLRIENSQTLPEAPWILFTKYQRNTPKL
jgi:hypothetical protein